MENEKLHPKTQLLLDIIDMLNDVSDKIDKTEADIKDFESYGYKDLATAYTFKLAELKTEFFRLYEIKERIGLEL